MSVIDDHSESINKLSWPSVGKRLIRLQPVLNERKRLKYQGFSKISKQNTKTVFLLNNSTTQSFPCSLFSSMFSLNVLYSSFNRHSSTKDFIYFRFLVLSKRNNTLMH